MDLPSVGMDSSIDINSKYIDNKTDEIKINIASPEKTSEAKDEVEVVVVVVVGPEVVTFALTFFGYDKIELEYSPVQNNTDFLNFDDEVDNDVEEPDEDLSDIEEKHLIDNCGWSSRTKVVGKYLQNMFNKEEENGRKALRMNNLLSGKLARRHQECFSKLWFLKQMIISTWNRVMRLRTLRYCHDRSS
ncbi:unnamed protein product [Lactuca virosa]|uniref:Uncharacterized protein n=1 Tax=Lactuca virosa TaxID=75947 RepID=A0AAU9N762_9ASTR|nr:unnamed protein product [Lactuca virosa]